MIIDLMSRIASDDITLSQESEKFLVGLYQFLDPYEPFLEQQSQAQKKWLYDLHKTHIGENKW